MSEPVPEPTKQPAPSGGVAPDPTPDDPTSRVEQVGDFSKWLGNRLLTGLFVAMPLVVSWYVVVFVYGLVSSASQPVVRAFVTQFKNSLPEALLREVSPGSGTYSIPTLGFFLTLAVLLGLGVAARHWAGERVMALVDRLMLQLPFVSTVYSATKQVMDSFQVVGAAAQTQFSKVVFLPFPGVEGKLVGFLIRTYPDSTGRRVSTVFLPTAPNPLTGFVLVMPEEEVEVSDMSVEDATKMIVSIGLVIPQRITFPASRQFRIEFTRP